MDKSRWFSRYKVSSICLVLLIFCTHLQAYQQTLNKLSLSAIADLSPANLHDNEWHTILPITGSDSEYFLATNNGKVYTLTDDKITVEPFLDIAKRLKASNIMALTAIAVDPSFHYRERTGYNTFYTAHTETKNNLQNKRITDANIDKKQPFDAVIMRWKVNKSTSQSITIANQQEVFRIAVHQPNESIKQLSFNPYTEPWHENFGLLFVLLSQTDDEVAAKQAIYSGTVLRIKPERFGLQSYTIPKSNPFIRQDAIRNEIVIIANRKVQNFDWIKNGQSSLLLQLAEKESSDFIQAKLGDDFRLSPAPPIQTLEASSQQKKQNSKVIIYQGRALQTLWGKVLQLNKVENDWFLQASVFGSKTLPNALPIANSYSLPNISPQEKLTLHTHNNNELLVLAHKQQRLYAIEGNIEKANITVAKVATSKKKNENSYALFFILFVIACAVTGLCYLKFRAKTQRHFLYSQWANFDIDTANQTLSLYSRHNKIVEKTIELSAIKSSEILLNNLVISTISANDGQGFSNDFEEQVLASFAKEHQLKMINDKQRKIQLRITDISDNTLLFCLYYRVGNIRHTKLRYSEVLNKVIDWNWLFAAYINAKHTSKRKMRVKPEITQSASPVNTSQQTKPLPEQPISHKETLKTEQQQNQYSTSKVDLSANQDAELVMALDKLVEMKKQGFLSDDEFNIAKAKIISDLVQ